MGPRAVKAFLSVPISSGAWKLGTRRMPQFGNSLLPNCRRVARGYWPKKSQFYRARLVDREICDICRSGLDQEMSQVYRPGCNRYPDPATHSASLSGSGGGLNKNAVAICISLQTIGQSNHVTQFRRSLGLEGAMNL